MKRILISLITLFTAANLQAQDSSSVLFIGNSYVYTNDLPSTLDQLATSLGKNLHVGSKTNGGYTFQNHYNDPATFTAIHQTDWNLIILQAQSQEPSFPTSQVDANTLPYSDLLADSAYASNDCANVMYFMTWGRENGDPQWDSINTFDKMNQRLYNAYMRFADSADAMVAPVAVAWKYVRDNHPTIQLYVGDGSHPTVEGTYLIASTFFASIYQESPVGAAYTAGLDPATAAILQNAAAITVLDSLDQFYLHPIDYRTVATFTGSLNTDTYQTNNTSIHAENYFWDFGDGNTSTLTSPLHTYTQIGTYTIQLIASSVCNNDTSEIQISVSTVGLNEFAIPIDLKEYPTYFQITTTEQPFDYAVIGAWGEVLKSGSIFPYENAVIPKSGKFGLLKLIGPNNQIVIRKYVQ